MSRSYKKNAIVKDYNRGAKKDSHRKFRKKSKQKIHQQQFEELPQYQKEVMNQYDVSDYKFIASEEDEFHDKFRRK